MRRRGESGQVLVIAALVQVVMIALVGFAADYGVLLVEKARLQNALDAASLAGARALVDGPNPGVTAAQTTVTQYLTLHGYPANAQTTITVTFPPSPGTGAIESVRIVVTKVRPTYFIKLVGISQTTIGGQATAAVDRRLIDIMLSLDLTGSMELSGTNDLDQLRRAVVDFINQINPSTADPTGPKVGIARFAGIMCRWNRTADPSDVFIDLGLGPSEYQTPCTDDKTVLTNLTQDKAMLIKIADGSGAGTCPGGMSVYACPLVSWKYDQVQDTNGNWVTTAGLRYNGSVIQGSPAPHYTGTKLPNAISVVSTPGTYHAWDTANGGRNSAVSGNNARKVLVLMTDGFNELWPSVGNPVGSASGWDSQFVNMANTLKLGPDGVAGTADDVEIYTIGFFCSPQGSQRWCASGMADATPHPCPGGAMPGTATAIDVLLRDASSSAPGTCDHYFPIKKTEDLPTLFRTLAGTIARGRLTQ